MILLTDPAVLSRLRSRDARGGPRPPAVPQSVWTYRPVSPSEALTHARSLKLGQGLTARNQLVTISEIFFAFTGSTSPPATGSGCQRSFGRAMPKRAQTHKTVSRHGWLSYTPPPFRQAVLDRCKLETFSGGATIFSVGDPPGGMYGLAAGSFAISIAPGERGPYVAHFAWPGTWFGEAAALTEQPRKISLAVSRDSEVLHLPLPAIREIVAADPGAWRFFGLAAVAHNDVAVGIADDLLIRDHVKRSVAVLLRLGGCRYRTLEDARPIEVDVSQEDFAAMTNTARTTAGSVLRKLEADGGVEVSYRRVRILAPDSLRAMLEP